MMAGDDAADDRLLVTTGCTQFEVKPGAEERLPDLLFGLSSEAFRVQMRALATGSDGLSSVAADDIAGIVLPKVPDPVVRELLSDRVTANKAGHLSLLQTVSESLKSHLPSVLIAKRTSHVAQV